MMGVPRVCVSQKRVYKYGNKAYRSLRECLLRRVLSSPNSQGSLLLVSR